MSFQDADTASVAESAALNLFIEAATRAGQHGLNGDGSDGNWFVQGDAGNAVVGGFEAGTGMDADENVGDDVVGGGQGGSGAAWEQAQLLMQLGQSQDQTQQQQTPNDQQHFPVTETAAASTNNRRTSTRQTRFGGKMVDPDVPDMAVEDGVNVIASGSSSTGKKRKRNNQDDGERLVAGEDQLGISDMEPLSPNIDPSMSNPSENPASTTNTTSNRRTTKPSTSSSSLNPSSSSRRNSSTARNNKSLRISSSTQSQSPSDHPTLPASPSGNPNNLSDHQKRMNHASSEQRRRDAIRVGYAELSALERTGVNTPWEEAGAVILRAERQDFLSRQESEKLALELERQQLESEAELLRSGAGGGSGGAMASAQGLADGSVILPNKAGGKKGKKSGGGVGKKGKMTTMTTTTVDADGNVASITTTTGGGGGKSMGLGTTTIGKQPTHVFSKAVILRKGAALAKWLTEGNEWLQSEVNRLEVMLGLEKSTGAVGTGGVGAGIGVGIGIGTGGDGGNGLMDLEMEGGGHEQTQLHQNQHGDDDGLPFGGEGEGTFDGMEVDGNVEDEAQKAYEQVYGAGQE